mmetsp:Transcript_34329/g.77578  ORF Transcript_34329/g.77578 Transcript_34329/m.77578 type:complete len:774 (-) Transcript_34329:96-2417(-)
MAGHLVEVLGKSAWFAYGDCPAHLKGKKFKLMSSDGEATEIEAEGLCMARKTMTDAVELGPDAEIEVPLKKATLAKVVEYLHYHKDVAPAEIRTPLESDNLAECGASKWDVSYINCDKDLMFELLVAAYIMEIPSLTFLAAAKASLLIKGRTPDKLVKDFKLTNDLPEEEDEALSGIFTAHKEKEHSAPDESGLGGVAILMNAVFQAAEKNNIYSQTKDDQPGPSAVSLKSYRHASWRAMILADWTQLSNAPEEVLADRDLIYAALGPSCGAAIQFVPGEFRDDRTLILEAVRYNGEMLKEASGALKSDASFVKEAIRVNGTALMGASDNLRGSKDFVFEAMKMGFGSAMKGAAGHLRSDKGFVKECAYKAPEAFKYASDELRYDRDFVLDVVSHSGAVLKYVPFQLQADREVAKVAVDNDATAIVYAHAAARADMDARLPWDSEMGLVSKKNAQESAGVGGKQIYPEGKAMAGLPLTKAAAQDHGVLEWKKPKVQKIVQFSALSTMTANMGQANYVAGNSYLDKLPYFERPEVDAVTLMWGAVGNIGMRWKAFASADMLNSNPEALMHVDDAARVLNITTCKMDPPEWYAASYFDEWTRQSIIAPTAGMIKGEDYQPMSVTPMKKSQEVNKSEADSQPSRTVEVQKPEPGPLGGWPGLESYVEPAEEHVPVVREQAELSEGDHVRLRGLQSKNGQTGVLLRRLKDGKWKVKMDLDGDSALLKASYLELLEPGAPVGAAVAEEAASKRKQESEARRARLKASAGRAEPIVVSA